MSYKLTQIVLHTDDTCLRLGSDGCGSLTFESNPNRVNSTRRIDVRWGGHGYELMSVSDETPSEELIEFYENMLNAMNVTVVCDEFAVMS